MMSGRTTSLAVTMAGIAYVLVVLASGCAASTGNSSTDGQALVGRLCNRCHPIDRVEAANHDRAGWTATVGRMRSHGLQVSDSQAAAIADYLTKLDGGQ
jgi:cytochrome c5